MFYLFDPSGSLSAFSLDRLGSVVPSSWKSLSEGPTLEVTEGLLGRITALKDARLTGQMVLQQFLFRWTLPLMVRPTPMWEYIRVGDPSVVVEGNLLEESMARVVWMVFGYVSGEPAVGEGLAPYSVYEPRPSDLSYLGVVSIPPSPRGRGPRPPPEVLLHSREVGPSCYPWGSRRSPDPLGSVLAQVPPGQGCLRRRGTPL